jgi:hypothetical protein
MSENIVEKLIQCLSPLKIPTERFLAILLLMSLFTIFMPTNILNKLSLIEFINNHKAIISVTFIFTSAYFIVALICKILDKIKNFNSYKKQTELLKNLPNAEKKIVLKMYKNGHSDRLSPTNPYVGSLCNKCIIYMSTNLGYQESFGYTLQPWVAKYIDKHRNYIN